MVLGFDISTSCIGIAILEDDGSLVSLDHIKIDVGKEIPLDDRPIVIALKFEQKLLELKEKYNPTYIFVEAPLKNSPKIDTVILLAQMNAMCCLMIYKIFSLYPIKIPVYECRKNFCPEFIRIGEKEQKNKEFSKAIRKYVFPKTIKKPIEKYRYVKEKLNPDFNVHPTIKVKGEIFFFPKELDVKHYIWEKVDKMYKLNWLYSKKGALETTNYDMCDAFVVGLAGLNKIKNK